MAAQLTAMKGRPARPLARCIAWANASLPEPVGPWMSTETLVSTIRCAQRTLRSICGSSPASSSRVSGSERTGMEEPVSVAGKSCSGVCQPCVAFVIRASQRAPGECVTDATPRRDSVTVEKHARAATASAALMQMRCFPGLTLPHLARVTDAPVRRSIRVTALYRSVPQNGTGCRAPGRLSRLRNTGASTAAVLARAIDVTAGKWTLSFDGNVNAHYIYSSCETHPAVVGGGLACVAADSSSSVSNGLLPAALTISGATNQDGYDLGFTFGLYPGISTNDGGSPNLQAADNSNFGHTALGTAGLDIRQVFLTVGTSTMGTIMAGRNIGLFGADAILND